MSEISSTISPISSDDSPSRLIRFDVSWICERMSFIPEIWSCTALPPFSAAASCASRHLRRLRRVVRDLVDRFRHRQHRRRGLLDLAVLPLRRFEQPIRDRLRFLRRLRHLVGRRVDAAHQRAQFLDREVDRIRDRARDVLGHRRLHGEVAVGEIAHFVQEPQDRFLVALVLVLAVLRPQSRVVQEYLRDHREAGERQQRERDREAERVLTRPLAARVLVRELRRVGQQRLGFVVHAARSLLRDDEVGHVRQDRRRCPPGRR